MSLVDSKKKLSWVVNNYIPQLLILLISSGLVFISLILPITFRQPTYPLTIGSVASQDIQAPYTKSFQSEKLTILAQREAQTSVSNVFLPADPEITRQQIERVKINLNYINSVRQDNYATMEQKLEDLSALADIRINPETTRRILALDINHWQTVQQEILRVLEQVMRNTIREDRISDAQRSIPALVSFSLPPDQSQIVKEFVAAFILPNSLYSAPLTIQAQNEAKAKVNPVMRSFVEGETIIRRGQIISDLDWETLQSYNLIQPKDERQKYIASAVVVLLISAFFVFYFSKRKLSPIFTTRNLLLISITFILFLFSARLSIPNRTIIPYLLPIPAFGMTIACLFDFEISIVLSFALSLLCAYGLPNSLDLTLYYLVAGLCGIFVLGKGKHISRFFISALVIGGTGSAVIIAYRLTSSITDLLGITTLLGAAIFNGFASASLALLFQFLFAELLGLTTALRLLDISRPDYPLLKFMLRNAPGTYQHSLQVANLAEQAAEIIGADTLLVRVGSIYHDSGKAINPSFFIENQIPGSINPHDNLDPVTSATTIIQHVANGVILAKKYHLPPKIQDFILEHHGTLITRYQYSRAVEETENIIDNINLDLFQYPGPAPKSRETALLMLADGCEAKARAEHPKDETEIRAIVKKVFDYVQSEGQLDYTTLTFKDLNQALESFVKTLQNTYHPRIQYPDLIITPHGKNLNTNKIKV